MKLLILFLLISVGCFGQKKHHTITKYHDSAYSEFRSDTTYGTIKYKVIGGSVEGDGILIHHEQWEWHTTVPRIPQPKVCDSCLIIGWSSWGTKVVDYSVAFLITSNGYKPPANDYLFIPKIKPKLK